MTNGLWGDLPTGENLRTPAFIVNEQISELQKGTRGVLTGKVVIAKSSTESLEHVFFIIAPALSQYSVAVFKFSHAMDLYPCVVTPLITTLNPVRVPDEASFCAKLAEILQHEKTRNVIAGLLAQTRVQGGMKE